MAKTIRKKYLCLNKMEVRNKCTSCNEFTVLKNQAQFNKRDKVCPSCNSKLILVLE